MEVKVAGARHIDFLSVPIHNLPEESLDAAVRSMLDTGGKHQIVLVSTWDLLKGIRNQEYRRVLLNASLVIPVTPGVGKICRFLKRPVPATYMPYEFTIKLLGWLEHYRKSVYLLGGSHKVIQTSASNLRTSFPGLNIVGRCSGYFKRPAEENIMLAIKKASPSLLLTGRGVKGGDRWLLDKQKTLSDGISLYGGDCFEVFAGKRRKPTRKAWQNGSYLIPTLAKKPWRLLRGVVYFFFGFRLLIARIRKA